MMEFLLIWAVGSILGVTKAVDMKFTNQYGICRLQVMVLDPLLIPQFIEVVIGECLFELQFRVEENMDSDSPVPVDMDDFSGGEDENKSDQLEDVVRGGNSLPPNNSAPDSGKSVSKGAGNDGNTGKKGAAHDVISSVVQYADLGLGMQGVEHAGNPTQAVVPATSSCMVVSVSCTPDVVAMAAVPEATMGLTESGRSKRRNRSGNGDSMQRASKLKVARNLDAVLSTGNSIRSLPYVLIPDEVVQRLTSLGFVCGNNDKSWDKFLELLTNKLSGESGSFVDAKSVALEREEKERLEDQELDNFILGSLRNDMLEGVMDFTSEHIIMSHTSRPEVTKSSKKKSRNRNKIKSVAQ
ncbi:uncharacterized protein [Zea mays]|uniref:uncharacterized protein n=1 Tax=Zea mays TaxID=4577 RepID=UPI001651B152|nr:uncharacterized protein LOC118476877 [Zea mays]